MPNKPDTSFSANQIVHRDGTSLVNGTYTQTPTVPNQYDPRVSDAPVSGHGISYSANGSTSWLPQPTSNANLQWDNTKQEFVWVPV